MDPLLPQLSVGAQNVLRMAYAAVLIATLCQALPQRRRYFLSERWGGFAARGRAVEIVHSPFSYPIVLAAWSASAFALLAGVASPWAALINLLLCRYFFVQMRWKSVLRGMGAPGFMLYWLGAVVFLLELTQQYAPGARSLALLVAQVDIAFIMLSAGIYKLTAGYARNEGMDLGLANPMWGYWWRRYAKLPPGHWLFRALNHLAWSTEIAIAVLILIPATRFAGGLLLAVSFAFIATQIRLGFLCETVIVAGLLFVGGEPPPLTPPVTLLDPVLRAALLAYLCLLPLAHAGLFYNFYGRRSLPLQRVLERYTNCFGLIIWRVFSSDITNFVIEVYRQPRADGARQLVSRYGLDGDLRFNHVAESIALSSLFTTLKYYPADSDLFRERILRYSRTIPSADDALVVFDYVSIRKQAGGFVYVPVARFTVDTENATVHEQPLVDDVAIRQAHAGSPLVAGVRPGSYVPCPGSA